jgi:hypothetical protein
VLFFELLPALFMPGSFVVLVGLVIAERQARGPGSE